MAKPGDIVEFKNGLFGLEAPRNLAIHVKRWRNKGTPWVRLVTLEGLQECKAEHLSRRAFKERFVGDLSDVAQAKSRLAHLISVHADGALLEEQEDDLAELERRLWEATCDDERPAWTEEELAAAVYGEGPSPQQLKDVRGALDQCRRPGTGRFETAGQGDLWRPWSREEHLAMTEAWKQLQGLRAALVAVENTDEGRSFRRIEPDDNLRKTHGETMDWMQAAMVQAIEHDGVPDQGVVGIAGLGAVAAFGMDLHRELGFLAQDWITSGHTTRSSDYIHFLLEAGLWSPDDAVQSLMRRHVNQEVFFEHTDDEQAEQDAEGLDEPDDRDLGDREDLRHLRCFTIDPPDAKDFDDAIGIEDGPDGGTRLWIHIADVSHYVRPGTHLDRHAKKRATSVYLPGRVLPMLPHRIADHLCSLRDDGDRYALSVHLDIGADGKSVAAGFHKSLIRVTENLAYDDALNRRDGGDAELARFFDLAAVMQTHRKGLALDTGERKILIGSDSFEALEKRGNEATQMIETFMVAANEAVAAHLENETVPLLFRCHPLPDREKAGRFSHQAPWLGVGAPMDLPKSEGTPAAEMSLLEQLKSGGGKVEMFGGLGISSAQADEPHEDTADETEAEEAPSGFAQLSTEEQDAWLAPFRAAVDAIAALPNRAVADVATLKLLACMGRAYYTPGNEGHFGLGLVHYCHFTSPIRRYPDLVVHRQLKWLLSGRDGPIPYADRDLQLICDHCSDQERAAADLERRVKNACMVLASVQAGETSGSARITGLTPGGIFVRRPDGIEARVAARDLPGGPFDVDEWQAILGRVDISGEPAPTGWRDWEDPESGERWHVRGALGDSVSVRLAGRDVAEGRTGAELLDWSA